MKPGHHQRSSYGSESSFVPRLLPRIPVSSQFLLEFLHAVYFAMYVVCVIANFAELSYDIHISMNRLLIPAKHLSLVILNIYIYYIYIMIFFLYFISRYNECWYIGNQAVEDIHNRVCYELYPDVMLVTNAIRNSASTGASGN